MLEFKKKLTRSKKLKYKIDSWVFVPPLYEMVFLRNGLCMKMYVKIQVLPRTKKSLFEVTPLLLYEMVSLERSGLCSKWSLYEVTVNPTT